MKSDTVREILTGGGGGGYHMTQIFKISIALDKINNLLPKAEYRQNDGQTKLEISKEHLIRGEAL